ncbi:hypothetical protein BJV82DRAFT_660125 [Fennellomyces sp. T-0311]|nr:hypothetical protein BJV82DRAFT_660125 [Fennellomyces sp. T-0311]
MSQRTRPLSTAHGCATAQVEGNFRVRGGPVEASFFLQPQSWKLPNLQATLKKGARIGVYRLCVAKKSYFVWIPTWLVSAFGNSPRLVVCLTSTPICFEFARGKMNFSQLRRQGLIVTPYLQQSAIWVRKEVMSMIRVRIKVDHKLSDTATS